MMRGAVLSDSHLGYAAKCRTHARSGLNQRVVDGYRAFADSITQIIEAQVDFVVHGGDLFHRSWPSVGDIVWARTQLQRLADAGIPVYGNTGNHDASSERGKSPATAAVHDPGRGIHMITDPYARIGLADGLVLHAVSHYGLAQSERLLPEPVDGAVNLFTAHGAALVPGHEIFHCADSPGEQPIGLDLLIDDRFAVKLLGHYHGMGEIAPRDVPNVWYAGSSIRRGFSDPEGGRGWLLVTVHDNSTVSVEPQYIGQRDQFDLTVIDASGLTGADVEERIRANLAGIDFAGAPILRQVVKNCGTAVRRGIDQPALARLAGDALMWMPDFRRPEVTDAAGERTVDGVGASLKTAGASDLPRMYSGWVDDYATEVGLSAELKPIVVAEGERHLRVASQLVEAGDMEATAVQSTRQPAAEVPVGATVTELVPPVDEPPADYEPLDPTGTDDVDGGLF